MFKVYIMLAALALLSCEEKEAVGDKTADSYKALIEKAKGTEADLQKNADSIVKLQEELGVPH